jgi:hypothetical protein
LGRFHLRLRNCWVASALAPKADKWADIALSLLCADFVAKVLRESSQPA